MKNKHRGTTFESYLKEKGLNEEIEALAIKQILAMKIESMMEQENISKSEMARLMDTKRTAVYNLLDPNKDCKLTTIAKAARVLGKKLKLDIVSA